MRFVISLLAAMSIIGVCVVVAKTQRMERRDADRMAKRFMLPLIPLLAVGWTLFIINH